MLLTSINNVKALLSITSSDNDALLVAILTGVSAECENYLDRKLETKERTQYFDAFEGQQTFSLEAYPVSALAAYNDTTRAFTAAISADNLTFLGNDGLLRVDQYEIMGGAKVLKVVYTGGLAADQASLQANYPDLELAARMQSAFVFEKRNKLNVSSESVAGSSINIPVKTELLPEVKDILDRYRRQAYV